MQALGAEVEQLAAGPAVTNSNAASATTPSPTAAVAAAAAPPATASAAATAAGSVLLPPPPLRPDESAATAAVAAGQHVHVRAGDAAGSMAGMDPTPLPTAHHPRERQRDNAARLPGLEAGRGQAPAHASQQARAPGPPLLGQVLEPGLYSASGASVSAQADRTEHLTGQGAGQALSVTAPAPAPAPTLAAAVKKDEAPATQAAAPAGAHGTEAGVQAAPAAADAGTVVAQATPAASAGSSGGGSTDASSSSAVRSTDAGSSSSGGSTDAITVVSGQPAATGSGRGGGDVDGGAVGDQFGAEVRAGTRVRTEWDRMGQATHPHSGALLACAAALAPKVQIALIRFCQRSDDSIYGACACGPHLHGLLLRPSKVPAPHAAVVHSAPLVSSFSCLGHWA